MSNVSHDVVPPRVRGRRQRRHEAPAPKQLPPVSMPPDGAALLARVRQQGLSDGRAGVYDQWSFDPGSVPAQLSYLWFEGRWALDHAAERAAREHETGLSAQGDRRAETAGLRDLVERFRNEARDAALLVGRARARMDRQATVEAHRRERRLRYNLDDPMPEPVLDELTDPRTIWVGRPTPDDDPVTLSTAPIGAETDAEQPPADEPTGPAEPTGAAGPAEPTGAAEPAEPTGAAEPTEPTGAAEPTEAAGVDEGDAVDGAAEHPDPGPGPDSGRRRLTGYDPRWQYWEGPYSEPIGARARWSILIALWLTELPIQWSIFDFFHGRDPWDLVMTTLFTLSMSLVMVLGPHLAGRFYRDRAATGVSRLVPLGSLALLLPLAVVVVGLGVLRRKVLFAGAGAGLDDLPSRVDQLDVQPWTVTVLFVALLAITAGLSFLLGLARPHPWQVAYRDAELNRRALQARVDQLQPEYRRAQARLAVFRATGQHEPARLDAEEQRLRSMYDAAGLAYLDGVQQGLQDPAASAAVATLAERLRQERGPRGKAER